VEAIAPGGIEPPTSGSKVPHPSPAGTPGLHRVAIRERANLRSDVPRVHRPRVHHSRCDERKPECRTYAPGRTHPSDGALPVHAGDRPVFPSSGRVVRVGAGLCGQ